MFKSRVNIDKSILIYAYFALLLPVVLFLIYFTKLYIGIPIAFLVCFSFILIVRQKREYKDVLGIKYKKLLALIGFFALIWTALSGQGGLFFQNADYHMRNAIFYDLLNYDWPVIFNVPQNITEGLEAGSALYNQAAQFAGKEITIVYYLGYWLPSALAGKLFILVLGQQAGFAAANVILFLWTYFSVFSVLYLFCRALNKVSCKVILIFIFFSGMDAVVGSLYYAVGVEKLILFPEGRIFPHLDAWTMQQYTSNTSALFWVFNQALPLWLFCGILLNEDNLKYIFLPFTCLALNSTLPMIGVFPIIIYFIVTKYFTDCKFGNAIYDISLKGIFKAVKQYLNLPNFCSIAVFIISYLYLISSPHSESFSFMRGSPDILKLLIIFISLLLEVLLLIYLLFLINKDKKDTRLLIFITVVLTVIPFINIGTRYDFTMRASLAPLFILCFLTCKTLLKSPKSKIKLYVVLVIGGITALCEILQPIAYYISGQNPIANSIGSLANVSSPYFDPSNCLGELTSFFMRFILRR